MHKNWYFLRSVRSRDGTNPDTSGSQTVRTRSTSGWDREQMLVPDLGWDGMQEYDIRSEFVPIPPLEKTIISRWIMYTIKEEFFIVPKKIILQFTNLWIKMLRMEPQNGLIILEISVSVIFSSNEWFLAYWIWLTLV